MRLLQRLDNNTLVCTVKAMVFPVVMYGCENWTINKPECWRIDAFELVLEKSLESPWTARRSNQPILKEINPKNSLEGLILKLKLQYFGHLMQKNWLIGKDPDAGKGWRQEEKGTTEDEMVEWHHWLHEHEFKQASGDGEGQGSLVCCSLWGCKESDRTERLNKRKYSGLWASIQWILVIYHHLLSQCSQFTLEWSLTLVSGSLQIKCLLCCLLVV